MRISCQSQFGWKMGIHLDFLELLLVAWNDSELIVKNGGTAGCEKWSAEVPGQAPS